MFKIIFQKKERASAPPLFKRFQLFLVDAIIICENAILSIFCLLIFPFQSRHIPRTIVIYKIGNMGDIVCAIPSFIAIRRAYPKSKIILLTSPGPKGSFGAKELLREVEYIDKLIVYHTDDFSSLSSKIQFITSLHKEKPDLFIQLPDDLVDLKTLLRNLIFAKLIGSKKAIGFAVRTIQLFKNTQVDFLKDKTETESLIDLLKSFNIPVSEIKFDFSLTKNEHDTILGLLNKHNCLNNKIIIISPGGKRPSNRWASNHFREVVSYLASFYNAKIFVLGSKSEKELCDSIVAGSESQNIYSLPGVITIRETIALLGKTSLVISNSTGTLHLAASLGVPVIGIYSVRDVLGRWFPYGQNHQIFYKNRLPCDYKEESCIQKSIEAISVKDVKQACDDILTKT